MTPDLVSIVIVCYNNWPDLELAIESALHQSYRPVEVIVVDNDSSDATPVEVPKRFGNAVRYHRQSNRGDSGGYNAGMALAAGEFIQFIDGDDVLAPNKIQKQVGTFRADPKIDVVYGDVRHFVGPPGARKFEECDLSEYDDMVAAIVDPAAKFAPHSFLYRRRALDRVGPWDESLYVTDTDYWLRAAWAGCRFRYCPGSLYFYRRRPGQMSADSLAMLRGGEAVWVKALGYVSARPYRDVILSNLGRVRFHLAVLDYTLSIPEALSKLASARASDRKTVSALVLVVAAAVIVLPGARQFVRSPWLQPARRWFKRWKGLG